MPVGDRLRIVQERIAEAAANCGRSSESIRLVGVCKGFPAEVVAEALDAGLTDVGENRVQEAAAKVPLVHPTAAGAPRWHLVGHLQTNKVKAALDLFDTIQSVDSLRVARAISQRADRPVPIFLEVQFVQAPDRFGFEPGGLAAVVDELSALPRLDLVGLMTVAPLGLSADETRLVFRRLRERRDALMDVRPELPHLELSMGMTDDFPIAIEEGSTVVRIGRAIFAG